MNYTLDSVEHAKEAIRATFNKEIISSEPILITDSSILGVRIPNRYFFGRITTGSDSENVSFYLNNKKILTVDPNSQIDLLFDVLQFNHEEFKKALSFDIQFRGFEIIVR